MARPQGHGRRLSYYDFGRTTVFACGLDQRFCYCAYVPEDYDEDGTDTWPLAVIVHGTERGMQAYRDGFADFAEKHGVIVLAPLFPVGITEPGELSSYKLMRVGDLHYDAIMLAMIAEMQAKYRIEGDRVLMYGFSGGGHFTHRFLYLHPDRLLAASIGAPGIVTLLDFDHDYWVGVRNFEAVFGKPLDLDAIRRVPVHMLIGGDDTETWEITVQPGNSWWMDGAGIAGRNRQDRMRSLRRSLEAQGVSVQQDTIPGIGHDDRQMLDAVKRFFGAALEDRRRAA